MYRRPGVPKPGGDALAEQLAKAKALREKKPMPKPKKTISGEFPAARED